MPWSPASTRVGSRRKTSLAWVTGGQASIRHDDRRSRARWNVGGDHKSSIWFSTIDGARELVCADVAWSGNHCGLRKRPFWKLLAFADAVIESTTVCSQCDVRFWHKADISRRSATWLLALSGHANDAKQCLLSGVKRTWIGDQLQSPLTRLTRTVPRRSDFAVLHNAVSAPRRYGRFGPSI